MGEKTFALIYEVYHQDFPENSRKNGRKVIQQTVTSTTDNDTVATRLQAFKQTCGYLFRYGIRTISPDDPGFDPETDVKLLKTERRINGLRPSTVARARRRKQGLEKPEPVFIPAPQSPAPTPKPAAKTIQPTLAY